MKSREERASDDFEFLVVAHAVGDPWLYSLLRDRTLDNPEPPTSQELGNLEYRSWFKQEK